MYWLRLWRIGWLILRYRLDTLVPWSSLPWWVRWLSVGRFFVPRPRLSGPVRLRLFFESLGPVFVKFGQILSTRRDLYPKAYADELVQLQDSVPSFPGEQALAVVEDGLEMPVSEAFATFDPQPLASASIAQVHAATLHNGRRVVVKIIRPDIRRVIQKDLAWMRAFARLLSTVPEARRLRPVEVVEDFRQTLLDELDLMREAANTTHLRHNFEGSDLLYVPAIHWDYCRSNILVMDRIDGLPIDEVEQLKAAGVDMKSLAETGVEIFFTQVFRDSFFHADMHPGNVFVNHKDPANPQYIAIDCGIVGTLAEEDQHYLAMNLLAFFNRDYHQVARLHVESGWVPSDTPIHHFEQAIRAVCEPIFARPLKDISFGLLLVRLFQVARRFNMEVQPQLVLLQKTLLNIEGLGRQLYPDLDLWATAKPFMEKWLRDRIGLKRTVRSLRQQLPFLLEQAPEWPYHIEKMVKELGRPRVQTVTPASNPRPSALHGVILCALGIGLAVYGDDADSAVLLYSGLGLGLVAGLITLGRLSQRPDHS